MHIIFFLTSYAHDLYTYIIFSWYIKRDNLTDTKNAELMTFHDIHNLYVYLFLITFFEVCC
jgi:hypothetical protein